MVSVPPRTAGAPVQQQADGDGSASGFAGLPGHRRLQPAQRCRHLPGGPGGHRPHTQSGRQGAALKGPEDGFLSFLNPCSNHNSLLHLADFGQRRAAAAAEGPAGLPRRQHRVRGLSGGELSSCLHSDVHTCHYGLSRDSQRAA